MDKLPIRSNKRLKNFEFRNVSWSVGAAKLASYSGIAEHGELHGSLCERWRSTSTLPGTAWQQGTEVPQLPVAAQQQQHTTWEGASTDCSKRTASRYLTSGRIRSSRNSAGWLSTRELRSLPRVPTCTQVECLVYSWLESRPFNISEIELDFKFVKRKRKSCLIRKSGWLPS